MIKVLISPLVLLFLNSLQAQNIIDVNRDKNAYTKVYDQNNKLISSGYVGSANDDFHYSECMLVLRDKNSYIKVYDEKLKLIASSYCGIASDAMHVSGCNLIFKDKNGYKKIYDKNLKLKSSGY